MFSYTGRNCIEKLNLLGGYACCNILTRMQDSWHGRVNPIHLHRLVGLRRRTRPSRLTYSHCRCTLPPSPAVRAAYRSNRPVRPPWHPCITLGVTSPQQSLGLRLSCTTMQKTRVRTKTTRTMILTCMINFKNPITLKK